MGLGNGTEFCYVLCENCLWQQQSQQFVQIQIQLSDAAAIVFSKSGCGCYFKRTRTPHFSYVSVKNTCFETKKKLGGGTLVIPNFSLDKNMFFLVKTRPF